MPCMQGISGPSVYVMTPYNQQKYKLQQELERVLALRPELEAYIQVCTVRVCVCVSLMRICVCRKNERRIAVNTGCAWLTCNHSCSVQVLSVDAVQGSEADATVLSLVSRG